MLFFPPHTHAYQKAVTYPYSLNKNIFNGTIIELLKSKWLKLCLCHSLCLSLLQLLPLNIVTILVALSFSFLKYSCFKISYSGVPPPIKSLFTEIF